MPDRPTRTPTPAAIRLAERYGMTPEAMEAIVGNTPLEHSQTVGLPTAVPMMATPIEEAASILPEPEITSKSIEDNPTAPPVQRPVATRETKPLGGGALTIIFVVLLIGLGLALSFQPGCFRQRKSIESAEPVDTIQNLLSQQAQKASTPPETPTQVSPDQVPPEALVVPREEPPGTSGKPSNSGITTEKAAKKTLSTSPPKPMLQTSSNFEAEERLAELRADGNTKAHMTAVHKNNGVVYRIYSR